MTETQEIIDRNDQLGGLRIAVTGGTSGLGLALVRLLKSRGAEVAFVARTEHDVARVSAETGAIGIVGDVGNKADIHPIALQVNGNLGGLDVLINNASSLGPVPLSHLGDTDCEDLEEALRVNVLGPFRLTKALFGALATSARQSGAATVINITSDAALNAYPGWGAYGASKAALQHMTDIWDQEAKGLGIRLVAVDPGDMDTPLHAIADPDTDPASLKDPSDSAIEVVEVMAAARQTGPAAATASIPVTS